MLATSEPTSPTTDPRARRTMQISIVEGGINMGFVVWSGGSLLTAYALHLHADPKSFGLIGGLPLIAQALTPVIAWLAARSGQRKLLTVLTAIIGRGAWALAPLIMLLPHEARLWALLAIMFTSGVFQSASNTLLGAWMGDVVPERERGRYFGFRGSLHGFIGMIIALIGGVLLDRLDAPLKFQLLFSVGAALGLLSIALVSTQWDPPSIPRRESLLTSIRSPLRDANFRRFIGLNAYWAFAGAFVSPFMLPFFYSHLDLKFTHGAVYSVLVGVLGLLLVPQFGRLADRVGHKPVFAIAAVGAGTLLPLVWLAAQPGMVWVVWLSAIFDTIVTGAGGAALGNLLLGQTPREQRAGYMSVLGMVAGIAGFTGALLAGHIVGAVNAMNLQLGSFAISGFHAVFLIGALLRGQAWALLAHLGETGAWRVREVLRLRSRPA